MARTGQRGSSCTSCRIGELVLETGEPCPFAPRQRRREELIYLQGEPATSAWHVKSGVVVLRRASSAARGRGVARCIRTAGALIGAEAILGDSSYADSAEAGTDVVLCGASRDDVIRWLGAAGAGRVLLESAVRASANDGALKSARAGSAVERVAAWVLAHDDDDCRSLSRGVVADLLGVRAETLSRALAELVRRGAIGVTRADVSILDRQILAEVSSG